MYRLSTAGLGIALAHNASVNPSFSVVLRGDEDLLFPARQRDLKGVTSRAKRLSRVMSLPIEEERITMEVTRW